MLSFLQPRSRLLVLFPLALLLSCDGSTTDPPAAAAVEILAAATALMVGETLQLSATATDAGGNPLPGYSVEWASSDTAVARVSATGLVTALSAGAAVIRAHAGGKAGEIQLTISGVPAHVSVVYNYETDPVGAGSVIPAVATVTDAGGTPVPGTPVTVSTERGEVAPASGITDAAGRFDFKWTLPTTLPPIDRAQVSLLGPIRWNTMPADTLEAVVTASQAFEIVRLIVAPGAPIGILPFDTATATMKVGDPYKVIPGFATVFDRYDNTWNVDVNTSIADDRDDADVVTVASIVFRCTPWPCNLAVYPKAPGVAVLSQTTSAGFTRTLHVTVLPADP